MLEWLLGRPWLPFLILGVLITLAVFLKVYFLRLLVKIFRKHKK